MIWMLPIGLLMTTLLAMGIGLMLAPLNVISEDIGHLFRFIVRAGFFVSPVMWTYEMFLERDPTGQWIDVVMLNPMVVPLTLVRHGIDGSTMDIATNHMLYSIVFSVAVFLIGMTVFKRWESKVVKYL
jgi:ABC-2 type transport system permease protein